jgi:hypothetical protein
MGKWTVAGWSGWPKLPTWPWPTEAAAETACSALTDAEDIVEDVEGVCGRVRGREGGEVANASVSPARFMLRGMMHAGKGSRLARG